MRSKRFIGVSSVPAKKMALALLIRTSMPPNRSAARVTASSTCSSKRMSTTQAIPVPRAADRFGGIDVLINNASAIFLAGTLDTPMKRFDLMHQVNVRGTYLCSQKCLPHLFAATNPHILNISPPLNMEQQWFAPHVAYTMAKFGMSQCVLGMSAEFKTKKVAVNALWPRTAIATAAVQNLLGGPEAMKCCRKPEIMADAAHWVLTQDSSSCTGNFFVDDDVLKESGVTNLDQYAVDPTAELMPDFFL